MQYQAEAEYTVYSALSLKCSTVQMHYIQYSTVLQYGVTEYSSAHSRVNTQISLKNEKPFFSLEIHVKAESLEYTYPIN